MIIIAKINYYKKNEKKTYKEIYNEIKKLVPMNLQTNKFLRIFYLHLLKFIDHWNGPFW